jgi:Zn-dependent protease with chaperone function
LHRLRPFLLLVLVPVFLFAAHQSLLRYAKEFAESSGVQIAIALSTPLLFLLMPLIAKPALGLKSLPPGHHRDRLEETAKRLNFRCADLLLWPTQRTVANAMVLGLVPRARYVVFTDQLLDHLDDDELEAVFGHEVGHVKHGHLLYYACFLILSMMVILTAAAGLVNEAVNAGWITEADANSQWLALPPMAILAGYLFVVFGLMSRKCERQADLYGVRTVASGRVEGHPLAAGVYSMQRALGKVAYVNGLDYFANESASFRQRVWARIVSWQHGSIADRIEFLHRILDDPTLEDRVQLRITFFRWAVILALLFGFIALGYWIEWPNVVAML